MPIYEYRCRSCRRRVQILTLRVSESPEEVCQHCGGTELDRLMSRFAMPRSEESRLDALGDPSQLSGLDENDPRSVARWMRKMGRELGDEVAGAELDQAVEELESGGGLDDGDGGAAGDDGEL